MFTKPLALFLFPALAAAQYGGAPLPTPASTASGSASASATPTLAVAPTAPSDTPGQMNIDVAFDMGFVFNPPNISAPVGTIVTFYFPNFGLNHSVTQSTFAAPCTYLAANSSTNSSAGFDSNLVSASTFTINITDTNPIWYFCKHIDHCEMGMVGSINAVGDTYATYLAAAKAITNEPTTPATGPVIAGVGASATGPPVPDLTSTSAPSTTTTSGAMKVTTSIGFALFATVAIAIAMA